MRPLSPARAQRARVLTAHALIGGALLLGVPVGCAEQAPSSAQPAPAPAPAPVQSAPAATPATPPAAVQEAARAAVAAKAGVSAASLQIAAAEAREWSDACLGLGGPAELCAQMITPGWSVVLSAGDQRWSVRTDAGGATARVEN